MIIKSPSIWNINGIRMVPGRWSNLANQHQSFLWSVGRFLRIEIVQNSDHLGSVKNGDNAEIVVFICNYIYMGMGQNHVALVNIKIGGKWIFIP